MRSGLNGDAAWLLYVAGRVADGSRLYVDLVEVNPPLVVWLNLPVVWLARGLGASEISVYRGAVWATVAATLWLSARLLPHAMGDDNPMRRAGLLAGAGLFLVALPGPYFGQREHLALALLLPWLLVSGARARGQAIGRGSSLVAGFMAAAGMGLKPHYVLVGITVGLYVRVRSRDGSRGIPLEQMVIVAALLVYAAAVLVGTPEYRDLVSRLGATYWEYGRRPVHEILLGGPIALTVLASVLLWPLLRRVTPSRELGDVLGLAALGFLAAVVLQGKGFGYHYYPALGTALLALILGAMGGAESPSGVRSHAVMRALALGVALPSLAALLLSAVDRALGGEARWPETAGNREVAAFLRAERPRGAVVVFSPRMDDSFPLFLESGLTWGSRYPFMWFVGALHRDELRSGSGRLTCRNRSPERTAERALLASVAEDLHRHRPALVLARRPRDGDLVPVDLVACFSRDSAFKREFAVYRPRAQLEHFVVFERVGS